MIIRDFKYFASIIKQKGRILSLDIGSRNIGIALSDRDQLIATPKLTLKRIKTTECIDFIDNYINENKAVGIVSGIPLDSSENGTNSSQKIMNFLSILDDKIHLPIYLNNEYLTSFEAEHLLIDNMDISYKKTKQIVDKIAASFILQDILDKL